MGATVSYLVGSPGPNGFGPASTAEDVTRGLNLEKLTIMITGATSGIGFEAAKALAERGARIVMPSLTMKEGLEAKDKIVALTPKARIVVMKLDLSDLNSVRNFATEFKQSELPLNVLMNNAGLSLNDAPRQTKDGLEMMFAVNFIGHYALTNLLLDTMRSTAKDSGIQGRIVIVSGGVYAKFTPPGGIIFEQLVGSKNPYYGLTGYSQSKLACIYHCLELSKQLEKEGANITVNTLHPGAIRTGLVHMKGIKGYISDNLPSFLFKTPQQGASTQVFLAVHPKAEGVTGKYYADCNEYFLEGEAHNTELLKKTLKWADEWISTH